MIWLILNKFWFSICNFGALFYLALVYFYKIFKNIFDKKPKQVYSVGVIPIDKILLCLIIKKFSNEKGKSKKDHSMV